MKQIDKIKIAVKEAAPDIVKTVEQILWQKPETIARNAEIEANKIATEINKITDITDYNQNTLASIRKVQVPSYMFWDFWNLVHSWVDYWVNRYKIECKDQELRQAIYTAIRNAVPFGEGCLAINREYSEDNENDVKYKSGSVLSRKTNYNGFTYKVKMLPAYIALDRDSYSSADKDGYKFTNAVKSKFNGYKWIDKNDVAILTWRWNRIGDFVWCMKELLMELYLKSIIEQNASLAINKPLIHVKNPYTLPTEVNIHQNPYLPYDMILSDANPKEGSSGLSNKIEYPQHSTDIHSEALITLLKHHQEWYYAKYGRPIQSMKKQTLSADASLTIASSESIAREHDERVKMFIDKVSEITGVEVKLTVDEVDTPEPANADDTEGSGTSTEAQEIREKDKEE